MPKQNVHKIIASNIELLIFFAIIVTILLSPFLYINLFESLIEGATFGVELLIGEVSLQQYPTNQTLTIPYTTTGGNRPQEMSYIYVNWTDIKQFWNMTTFNGKPFEPIEIQPVANVKGKFVLCFFNRDGDNLVILLCIRRNILGLIHA